ncbi:hypothetical protein M8J77_017801 [Diaphorina citri]|nr:hypothetical protein M8J77_017801 [Diaphorina citri]
MSTLAVLRRVVYLALISTILLVDAVDKNNFKTCEQSSFCRRCRSMQPASSPFIVIEDSVQISNHDIRATLQNKENNVQFFLMVTSLKDNTLHLFVNEMSPMKKRFQVPFVLASELEFNNNIKFHSKNPSNISMTIGEDHAVTLTYNPFVLNVYQDDQVVISVNSKGLMKFEHLRTKTDQEEDGAWEESFHSHQDSKPYGPTAVALDFSFPDVDHVYGVPEHADSFALRSTDGGQPYRLYNLDVFEYELDSPMSLYAAIPFVTAHNSHHSVGVFWLNAAETWVDVTRSKSTLTGDVMSKIVNFVSGSGGDGGPRSSTEVRFMSESGVIDVYLTLGPSPYDVIRQYSTLTGTAPLPPYFALAYHQCRWNYNTEGDVLDVSAKFDVYDMPMDVMWLDIEYTDQKKYFTWDPTKFPTPTSMVSNLTSLGRKLVVIIDPHIKRDNGYFLHDDATEKGYYVKNKDGNDFEGWCWPGSSSYLDFMNPAVRDYLADRYALENFPGSSLDVHIWNDMNEPSVFNGPEVTMPKDCKHYGDVEHRELHNIYGFTNVMATFEGLLKRSNYQQRPFILTRSGFAGSQRFGAIWTGDNMAEWSHLKISLPMCLSLAVSGWSFCGADVGGFFKNPDAELFTRWYQTGAFLPFFRGHAHIDTRRREPWLYGDATTSLVRDALRARYALLPYWYTLFHTQEISGAPVIRPLWYEFPQDKETFAMENQYLIGDSILVRPVTDPGATQVSVYFPRADEVWFDRDTYEAFTQTGSVTIAVSLSKIPTYQRGGTIIPLRERVRRASSLTLQDPVTLIVALNVNGTARGNLYLDDGQSYDYRKGNYVAVQFKYENGVLSSKFTSKARYPTESWLERVVILGVPHNTFSKALVSSPSIGQAVTEVNYNSGTKALTVRKPEVNLGEEWTISIE